MNDRIFEYLKDLKNKVRDPQSEIFFKASLALAQKAFLLTYEQLCYFRGVQPEADNYEQRSEQNPQLSV